LKNWEEKAALRETSAPTTTTLSPGELELESKFHLAVVLIDQKYVQRFENGECKKKMQVQNEKKKKETLDRHTQVDTTRLKR
jgi:hypothetical protein